MSKGFAYIFSTLTSAVNYRSYAPGGADMPIVTGSIRIEGGTNIPNKQLVTPMGVMTKVTEEQLATLLSNKVFQAHMENGFIKVENKPYEPEKVAGDMNTRDNSAPLVDEDFEREDKEAKAKGLTGSAKPKRQRRA